MPVVRITVDGRLALTVEQAAQRYRLTPASMRSALARLRMAAAAELDGRKQLYLARELDAAMKARPGKGANLRRPRGDG